MHRHEYIQRNFTVNTLGRLLEANEQLKRERDAARTSADTRHRETESLLRAAQMAMDLARRELQEARETSQYESSVAWQRVARALDGAVPGWMKGSGSGADLAVAAIKHMGGDIVNLESANKAQQNANRLLSKQRDDVRDRNTELAAENARLRLAYDSVLRSAVAWRVDPVADDATDDVAGFPTVTESGRVLDSYVLHVELPLSRRTAEPSIFDIITGTVIHAMHVPAHLLDEAGHPLPADCGKEAA